MKRLLSALSILLLIGACTNKVSYLSIVVPDNQFFDSRTLAQSTVRKDVTGESWRPIILFFPLGHPKFDTAVKEALENGHGNALTNVSVVEKMRWWILFGYSHLEVHGDAVDISSAAKRQKREQFK